MGSTPVLNVKALVGAFNQEKALVVAFSVITNLRMELFQALQHTSTSTTNTTTEVVTSDQPRLLVYKDLLTCVQIFRSAH